MKKKEIRNRSYYSDLSKDRNLEILKLALNELKEKYNLGYDEIINIIKEDSKEITIPISVFNNDKLSTLEIICKYLKEILNLNYHGIAVFLNRDDRTIWTTYQNSLKKSSKSLVVERSEIFIPISIFSDRKFSSFELLIIFLKERSKLRYNNIAKLLRKDQRNVWTVYNRAIKKRGMNEKK